MKFGKMSHEIVKSLTEVQKFIITKICKCGIVSGRGLAGRLPGVAPGHAGLLRPREEPRGGVVPAGLVQHLRRKM